MRAKTANAKDFSPAALAALNAHSWPGNVRELVNVVRAVVALHDGETVEAEMLPDSVGAAKSAAPTDPQPSAQPSAQPSVQPGPQLAPQPGALPPATWPLVAEPEVFSSPALPDGLPWFAQPDSPKTPAPAAAVEALLNGAACDPAKVRPLEQVEREAVDYALRAYGGNVSKAARALKVNASTLYRKIQVWSAGDGASITPVP